MPPSSHILSSSHTAHAFPGAFPALPGLPGAPDPLRGRAAHPQRLLGHWGRGMPLCMHSPPSRWAPHYLPPGLPSRTVSLPPSTRSVAAARRFSERLLGEWGLAELAADTTLLLSELVTNAIVHVPMTAGDVRLVLTRSADHLVAQVTDAGGLLPRCAEAGPDSENGRGMWLVEQIATQWGHHACDEGKTVWFTLRIPAGAPGA